jgi:hypothetical protein
MADTIGEDEHTRETIVAGYRAKFPEPEEQAGDHPPEPKPRPPRRPAVDGDDGDDFGGSFMVRE